jgi:hypothetical protein
MFAELRSIVYRRGNHRHLCPVCNMLMSAEADAEFLCKLTHPKCNYYLPMLMREISCPAQ